MKLALTAIMDIIKNHKVTDKLMVFEYIGPFIHLQEKGLKSNMLKDKEITGRDDKWH